MLSLRKVKALLQGRVSEEELDARARELLASACRNGSRAARRSCSQREGFTPEEREPFLRAAAAQRRPRHLILIETARENVAEEELAPLNELRRALDAGELGNEGIQTALRLGGGSAAEVKRILFRPPPREDD